jgi:hypothetical protein
MSIRYIRICPYRYKYEFVEWASVYFGKPKSKYTVLRLSQLRAIWHKEAEKNKNRRAEVV